MQSILKILAAVVLALLLLFFVIKGFQKFFSMNGDVEEGNFEVSETESLNYVSAATIWPNIIIRVDSVARINDHNVIVEWAYVNEEEDFTTSFNWGFSQPNYVALSKLASITDDTQFPVSRDREGIPICANTNLYDKPEWSKEIFGGRDLPVWAQFDVPNDASGPLYLYLHGLNSDGNEFVKVDVTDLKGQHERAFLPRPTNWPDIYIQLVSIEHLENGTFHLRWKYINQNKSSRFIWGLNQPNIIASTQVFDYSNGEYHEVEKTDYNGTVKYECSSINLDDGSSWSRAIEPGGELEAFAKFKNVKGRNVQVLFHSSMPLFYNPDRPSSEVKPTN